MADYHPLIARAVQGLPDPAPEMRAAVYDRARTALFAQLRSLDPPLSDDEFEAERHALETAIATVEAEYAGAAPQDEGGAAHDDDGGHDQAPHDAAGAAAVGYGQPQTEAPSPPTTRPTPHEPAAPPESGWNNAGSPASDAGRTQPDSPQDYPSYDPQEAPLPPLSPPAAMPASAPADSQAAPAAPAAKARPRLDGRSPRSSSGGGMRAVVVAVSLILVIGAIAFTAFWLAREDETPVAEVTPPEIEAPAPIEEPPRIEDRLTPDTADPDDIAPERVSPEPPTPLPDDEVGVAQRAMLYEEDPANPAGEPRAAAGSAVWRLDTEDPDDPGIVAQVRVPDMSLTMTMTIRRNLDPDLPASHTIELDFVNAGDENRNVLDAGLPHLKEDEVVRGAPLAGLTVPISDNFFLIGLSNLRADQQRNRNLLTNRNWIELPMRFAGGQRAVIAFDKGMSGQQVIEQAFAAWEE
ncbi:MAG: histidine kinase [Salinarimonas sp.]|nr:histidine kinase [Salinarimonas sp.]